MPRSEWCLIAMAAVESESIDHDWTLALTWPRAMARIRSIFGSSGSSFIARDDG
jgi:hypothetical protein